MEGEVSDLDARTLRGLKEGLGEGGGDEAEGGEDGGDLHVEVLCLKQGECIIVWAVIELLGVLLLSRANHFQLR